MQSDILDFFLRHWQLSSLLVVLLLAYILFELKYSESSQKISPEQVVDLYNREQALIIDIRSEEAYKKGHVIGSINMRFSELNNKLKKLQKYADRPVIIICSTGKESVKFAKKLQEQSFTKVLQLAGGISSWQAAGLPLVNK